MDFQSTSIINNHTKSTGSQFTKNEYMHCTKDVEVKQDVKVGKRKRGEK